MKINENMKAWASCKNQLATFQNLTKGVDACFYGFKVGHGQFHVDESSRDTFCFQAIYQLRAIESIRFTEFNVPE
jgi:hypothetical protein